MIHPNQMPMSECWDALNSWKFVPEDKCFTLSSNTESFLYEYNLDDGSGDFFPVPEEVIGFGHLFVDPQDEKPLDDDATCLRSGGMNFPGYCDTTCLQACYELEPDSGVDEGRDVCLTNNHLKASPSHLLGSGSSGENTALYCTPKEDSSLRALIPESYPVCSGSESGIAILSDLSKAIVLFHESLPGKDASFHDDKSTDEFHEIFEGTIGQDEFVCDKDWLNCGLHNCNESLDGDCFIENGLLSTNKENSLIVFTNNNISIVSKSSDLCGVKTATIGRCVEKHGSASKKGRYSHISEADDKLFVCEGRTEELVNRKRLRKPTRRYIEELSDKIQKSHEKITAYSRSSEKRSLVTTQAQIHYLENGVTQLSSPIEAPKVYDNLLSCATRVRRGHAKKTCTISAKNYTLRKDPKQSSSWYNGINNSGDLESESQCDLSDECGPNNRKVGVRRKHHRLWTLSEVMKLVEGVSRYGVGRWTEIKNLLFSSSAHRTSVDLKDKWRNLLKATGAHIHGESEIKLPQKHMSFPIPHAVIRRVRELSIVFPYPRYRKSRSPLAVDVASVPSDGNMSHVSRIRRVSRR